VCAIIPPCTVFAALILHTRSVQSDLLMYTVNTSRVRKRYALLIPSLSIISNSLRSADAVSDAGAGLARIRAAYARRTSLKLSIS